MFPYGVNLEIFLGNSASSRGTHSGKCDSTLNAPKALRRDFYSGLIPHVSCFLGTEIT